MAQYTIKDKFKEGLPVEKCKLHYCFDSIQESADLNVYDKDHDEWRICKAVNTFNIPATAGFNITQLQAIQPDENQKQTFKKKVVDHSFSDLLNIKYETEFVWIRYWDNFEYDQKSKKFIKLWATLHIPNKDTEKINLFLHKNADICSVHNCEGFITYKAKQT